jgi:hypothetical protein
MWLIVMVVVWLATLGMWYVANSDVDRFRQQAGTALAEKAEIEGRFDGALQAHDDLSAVVGYRDASLAGAKSDVAAIETDLTGIKAELGPALGGPDTPVTLADAVTALRSALAGAKQARDAAQADYERELAGRQAAEATANAIESNYQQQIGSLNQQLSDEQARADAQTQQDQATIAQLQAAASAADTAMRQAQQALADAELNARRAASAADATIQALAERRTIDAPEAIDGRVLSVGAGGVVAFIDLGARTGLRPGTRFEVLRPGKAGELTPHGTVEVRSVEDDMAMVGLLGEPDPFDPMLPGDALRNPHFEPGRVTRFFLLGDFPLTSSKEFVTSRLRELGSDVDETLSTSTDVLVLGNKSLAEGEFAQELTDTDEYKLADKLGIRIIRLPELAQFLSY